MACPIELMSPAGSWDALVAAVNAGADAVYLGGSRFGARHFADNFNRENLPRAVEFAHLRGTRIYVTVNILTADSEFADLADYLVFLHNNGADGIIIQDLGVAALARELVPNLPRFASTQLTVTDSESVNFAYSLGFSRVVLAREASLDAIRQICAHTPVAVEVFIHGALCMCYSGQCLMSSLIGGRSGNRGQCAQPCRLPYTLTDGRGEPVLTENACGQYLLSPKDLNALDFIPSLIEAGVSSFKIEGRMKRPEYVATVTDIYRRAIDSFLNGRFQVGEDDRRALRQIFNRGFNTAYLKGRPGRDFLSERRPNNRGVQVGRVTAVDAGNGYIEVKLEETLHPGDQVDVWVSVGGRAVGTVQDLSVAGRAADTAGQGETARFFFPHPARLNDRVFRTLDIVLHEKAGRFFAPGGRYSLPVTARASTAAGQPFRVIYTDRDGNQGEAATDFKSEPAKNRPLTEETVRRQLERLGGTDFHLKEMELDLPEGLMQPVSELNDARRRAIGALRQARLDAFLSRPAVDARLPVCPRGSRPPSLKPLLSVHCNSVDKAAAALYGGADVIIYGGDNYDPRPFSAQEYQEAANLAQTAGKELLFATPRILREEDRGAFRQDLSSLPAAGGLLVGSLAAVPAALDSGRTVWLDYSLNIFNSRALALWQGTGAAGAALSPELTLAQVEELAGRGLLPVECIVDGRGELMITEFCLPGALISPADDITPCRAGGYFLKDRLGELLPLVHDQFGRTHILNPREFCLVEQVVRLAAAAVSRLRIDGRFVDAATLRERTASYRRALDGIGQAARAATTRGHYFRGVLDSEGK